MASGQVSNTRWTAVSAKARAPRKLASVVAKIRNGNSASNAEIARWLDIAQPSSVLKWPSASESTRLTETNLRIGVPQCCFEDANMGSVFGKWQGSRPAH